MTDVAGNTSGHSPDFVLTVDTTVAPISDLRVTDNVGEEQGVVSNGGITTIQLLPLVVLRNRDLR